MDLELLQSIVEALPDNLKGLFKEGVKEETEDFVEPPKVDEEPITKEDEELMSEFFRWKEVPSETKQGRLFEEAETLPDIYGKDREREPEVILPDTRITAPSLDTFMRGGEVVTPVEDEPPVFPETRELQDVVEGMSRAFEDAEAPLKLSEQPLPQSVADVDPSTLTPADFRAAEQLMRGEMPTANLQQQMETAALKYYG